MGNDHKVESQKIETCVLQKFKSILKFSYRSKFSFCRRSNFFFNLAEDQKGVTIKSPFFTEDQKNFHFRSDQCQKWQSV